MNRLESGNEAEILKGIMDSLKADVMDPMLTWEERRDFQAAMEAIQERMKALKSCPLKVS